MFDFCQKFMFIYYIMESLFVKIILFAVIIICIAYFGYFNYRTSKCNLDNFNIDDVVVIKRTPEYSKLIDKMIDDKSFIFTDEQINVLKNPQQIFKVNNENNAISNISENIYIKCASDLDNQILENTNVSDNHKNYENYDNINSHNVGDKQYNKITKKLKDDIYLSSEPNCLNVGMMDPTIPFNKNYLNNYYLDIYGNRVNAKLSDYIAGYYTLINQDDNIGLPVITDIGHSNFIIPDQYNYDKHFTNAYNIDWNRIVNPIGYSM